MISMFNILWMIRILLLLVNGVRCTSMYTPYNITFNSSGFKWQGDDFILNIPEYDRIQFLFAASSLEPITEIKYGVRILSPFDNATLLRRPVYINKSDITKQVSLNLANPIKEFNIIIRGLVKVPNRFITAGDLVTVWSIQDTGVVYTGRLAL